LFKSMCEKVSLPLLIVDEGGRIAFANRGTEALTDYSPEELMEVNLRDICSPYERNRFIFSNLLNIKTTTEVDIDLRRKNGASFMASISFSPFLHQGRPLLLLIIRDVTHRRVQEGMIREDEDRYRKLLEERNRLEDQLKRSSKLASVGELAAGIAHEINNPLGIILGFAQDLLEDISDSDPRYESLKIIEQETARCGEVVKNLLDFARLKPPQITEVDVVLLLKQSVSLLQPRIKQNKIQIRRHFPKEFPLLKADPQLLQQVFLNVMLNGIQAMPYGGELRIGCKIEGNVSTQKSKKVRVTISDQGHGIHPDHLNRVFDPFFTTKGSKGTGLGLSVCQRIVEDHFGKIEIESTLDVGSSCHILLPIQ